MLNPTKAQDLDYNFSLMITDKDNGFSFVRVQSQMNTHRQRIYTALLL